MTKFNRLKSMSKCDFTITTGLQVDESKKLIKKEILDAGGDIYFDDEGKGKFSLGIAGGEVVGSLTVSYQNVHIKITDKPLLIPCKAIKSTIRNYL